MNYLKYFLVLFWYIMGFYFFGPEEWVRSPEMAVYCILIIFMPLFSLTSSIELLALSLGLSVISYGFIWIGGGNSFFPCWIGGSILLFLFSFSND